MSEWLRKNSIWTIATLMAVLLLLPPAFYIYTFGWHLATEHVRWGEFGSAMSGIYSPLTAVATLVVLAMQVLLQRRQTELQRKMGEHEVDQAFILQARADLEFYVLQLHSALATKTVYGNSVRELLLDQFQPNSFELLAQDSLKRLAEQIDRAEHRCIALWSAVYPLLVGLAAGRGPHFENNANGAMQKLVGILGFDVCVALDNFHFVRTLGTLKGRHRFSPLLAR